MTSLERSYRRLLLAYPGHYRRRHGSEIVTTLLEMSPAGRRRPSAAEIGHLVAAGLRQRFRLPARRPLVRIAAVLATLVLGAFGAAAGSWAAAATFAPLPGRAAFTALSHQVVPGIEQTVERDSTPHAVTSWFSAVDSPGWTPGPARDALRAAGWQLSPVRTLPAAAMLAGQTPIPASGSAFDATRDGLQLRVTGYSTAGRGSLSVGLWPAGTGLRWPLTVAGGLLGLLVGWLLTAAVAYRRRPSVLFAPALAALSVPALACYANFGLMWRTAGDGEIPVTVHSALSAGPFETYGWRWMMLELTVTGLVLGIAALALTARHRAIEAVPRATAAA